MPKRNWRDKFTYPRMAAGAVIFAALFWFVSHDGCGGEPKSATPKHLWDSNIGPLEKCQPNPETYASGRQKSQFRTPSAEEIEKVESSAACVEAKEDAKRDKADLEAQWRSASAAENSAYIACQQLHWSRVEFLALLGAFVAALWGVWVSRDTARRQLRAYVVTSLGSVINVRAGSKPSGSVQYQNVGQTPAYQVDAQPYVIFEAPGTKVNFDLYPPKADPRASLSLGSGTKRYTSAVSPDVLTQEDVDAIKEKRAAIFVFGVVTYLDLFDQKRTTRFRHRFSGPDLSSKGGTLTKEGNESD